jgi:hypothetical protein
MAFLTRVAFVTAPENPRNLSSFITACCYTQLGILLATAAFGALFLLLAVLLTTLVVFVGGCYNPTLYHGGRDVLYFLFQFVELAIPVCLRLIYLITGLVVIVPLWQFLQNTPDKIAVALSQSTSAPREL